MKDLQEMFNTPRTVTDASGQIWFAAIDVARALGYSNTPKAIKQHCTQAVAFKAVNTQTIPEGIVLQVSNKMIPESDVHRLIVNSSKPEAKKYEAWLFEEVLPSIRKTGAYIAPDANREEVLEKIRNMKATRKSIDEQREFLVSTIERTLASEHISNKQASAMVANVTDAIYQIALLKTASRIKYEQVMSNKGALSVITTNQLRKKEAEHKIDFLRAINYMNDSELEEVKITFNMLIPLIEGLGRLKYARVTTAQVKNQLRDTLKSIWSAIPEEVKESYSGQLVHHTGIGKIMDEINNRDGKTITKSDQIEAQSLQTRKAPFMN